MDWAFIQKYAPMYVQAAGLTLRIGAIGILIAVGVGLICCLARYYRVPVLNAVCGGYIELARNTPLLVQLFFLYFGLPKIGVKISGEACAIAGLAFLGGAYMAESFRSGLEAVRRAQKEAGACLGLTRVQNLRYVILPQALAAAIPAVCANVIFLLKETSVFSAISLLDLMFMAKDLMGMYNDTTEALCLLVGFYLIILLPISIVGTIVERRVRRAGFGG